MIDKFCQEYPLGALLLKAQKKSSLAHSFLLYGDELNYLKRFCFQWLEAFYFTLFDGKKSWEEVLSFTKSQFNHFLFHIKAENRKDEIPISSIRNLQKDLQVKTQENFYKVVLIEEAHLLTKEAQNAFLKTLEEPYDKILFILITTSKERLLNTVHSRCQKIPLFCHKKPQFPNFLDQFNLFSGINKALEMSYLFKKELKCLTENLDAQLEDFEKKIENIYASEKEKKEKLSIYRSTLIKKEKKKLIQALENKIFLSLKDKGNHHQMQKRVLNSINNLKLAVEIDFFNFDLSIDNFFLSLAHYQD